MELLVYSRATIESTLLPVQPHVIISVSTPGDDPARLPESASCRAVLRLIFPDLVEPFLPHYPAAMLFSEDHARQIWRFYETCKAGVKLVLVHCDAGMSRSPAIAAAIAKVETGNDAEYFEQYFPNSRVYAIMLDVYQREFRKSG